MISSLGTVQSIFKYNQGSGKFSASSIPDLLLWYTFDNYSGSSVIDASGNGYNGTDVENNTQSTSVLQGSNTKSAYFNGVTGTSGSSYHVISTPALTFNTNGLSFCFWMYITGSSSGDCHAFSLGTGNCYMWTNGSTELQWNTTTIEYTLTEGRWIHFVCTCNSSSVGSLYVNSVLQTSDATLQSSTYPTSGSSGLIGGVASGNGGCCINGYISNFMIYNTILTQSQINTIYANT